MSKNKTETIKTGVLYRSFDGSLDIDEEKRTVNLSFSSEQPVDRWDGKEILDHDVSSVQLERLRNGAPLLVDHDPADHVGVVENVSIDADRVGRALVRFGKSARATEIFNDVVDGIRKSISVGYRVFKAIEEDNHTYRVTDWMPLEISFVSVPADATVGVGRRYEKQNNFIIQRKEELPMSEENKETPEKVEPKIDVKAVAEKARKDELSRVRQIAAMSKDFDIDSTSAIDDGLTVDDFRVKVLESMKENKQRHIPQAPLTELGLDEKEVKNYSLFRAINATLKNDWKGAEFERDCSIEIAERLEKTPNGFYVPFDVQREMSTGSGGVGAVGTDHLASGFIDALRSQSIVMGLGARTMDGLVGNVDIPRLDSGATFYWIEEGADVTDQDALIGSVSLSPKTIAGSVPMTRRLLKQSSPSVEAMIRADLVIGAAIAIDAAAISGTGSAGQPTGIINQTGVSSVTIADAGMIPTFAEAVGFETAIAVDNALTQNVAYVTTPTIRGALKTAAKDAGSGIMLWANNELNGYRAIATNQVPAANMIMGDFSQLMIGMWGVLDVNPDTSTNAASAGLVLRVFQDIDVAVRHPESFAIGA